MEGVVGGDIDAAFISEDAGFNLPVSQPGAERKRDVLVHRLEGLEDKGVTCEVGESEEHHRGFEKSFVGNEGCLPLVAIFDSYIVVSPADVELSENLGVSQLVHEIRDEGKGVGVADGMFVDVMIVLAWAESSDLLFDKEKRGGLGRVGRADLPRC